jgi:uncharacterized membrane protein YccC
MLAATVLLTEAAAWWVALPLSQSITSVLMLSTAADRDAILRKGRDRVLGGLAGGLWVVAGVLLLHRLPGLPVFLAVYALGMFVAVHWALTSRDHAYGGYQMGLVIALAFVAEPHVAGSRDPVGQRFEGIFLGLVVSVVVAELWPGGGFRPRPAVNPGNPATPAVDARPG